MRIINLFKSGSTKFITRSNASIIKKIIRRLRDGPSSAILKFKIYYAKVKHLEQSLTAYQNELYKSHDLDRKKGLLKLDSICRIYLSSAYNEANGMFSEHLILLSALSELDTKFENILEIGTHNGESATILGHLFPKSKIVTIDLPYGNVEFSTTYNRQDSTNDFITMRDILLKRLDNVNFVPINSIALTTWKENQFDLIWIDGAHGYPTIAMDLVNAMRLIRKGGFILVDDVYTDLNRSDPTYESLGAFQSLEAMKNSALIDDYSLFCKRLGVSFNIPGVTKKYVGMIRV